MKIGTNLQFEQLIGYEKSIELAAQAGFKYLDFDLTGRYDCAEKDEEKYFGRYLKIAEDVGIKVSQAHAPYVKGQHIDPTVFTGKDFTEKVRTSIRRAAILKSPYLVLHLFSPHGENYKEHPYDYSVFAEDNFKRSVDFCLSLEKDLKEYNVNLALENVVVYDFVNRMHASCVCSTAKECNRLIDALGEKHYSICLDAGHLNLVNGDTHEQFVKALGQRISVLHLHDNFGMLNDWFGELDRHLPPYIGVLEWDKLANALKEVGYNGVYSFEVSSYGPTDNALDNYRYIYKAAKRIFYGQ